MHRPPAVSHHVLRSRWHLRTLVALWTLGLAASLLFYISQPLSWASIGPVLLGLVVPVPAVLAWRKAPIGLLQWDGQHWYWANFREAQICQLTPLLDLQSVMLVHVQSDTGHATWLWLEATAHREKWMALRRAVFGSQRHKGKPDAQVALQEGDFA